MTHNDLQSQAWAFAALFLAIDSVRALAERGEVRSEAELTLLPSLLTTNAADIADYYGDPTPWVATPTAAPSNKKTTNKTCATARKSCTSNGVSQKKRR